MITALRFIAMIASSPCVNATTEVELHLFLQTPSGKHFHCSDLSMALRTVRSFLGGCGRCARAQNVTITSSRIQHTLAFVWARFNGAQLRLLHFCTIFAMRRAVRTGVLLAFYATYSFYTTTPLGSCVCSRRRRHTASRLMLPVFGRSHARSRSATPHIRSFHPGTANSLALRHAAWVASYRHATRSWCKSSCWPPTVAGWHTSLPPSLQ